MIAAVVLAAGKSERMGFPKALLRFEGLTFLERVLGAIEGARLAPVVIVAGRHHRQIGDAFPTLPLTFNPNYEQGMSTSVVAGLQALPAGVTGAGVFLVDHPLVDIDTVTRLASRLESGRIVLPVHQGRRGHPVFFGAELFPEILALSPDHGLNVVVRRDPARVTEVEAPGGVLRDIDTPKQFEDLKRGDGR